MALPPDAVPINQNNQARGKLPPDAIPVQQNNFNIGSAMKYFTEPNPVGLTGVMQSAPMQALGNAYGQAKEMYIGQPENPANKLSPEGMKFNIPYYNSQIPVDLSPRSVAKGAQGLGIDAITGLVGGGLANAETPLTVKDILRKINSSQTKGYKLASELIQPNVEEQAQAMASGKPHPSVEQFFQHVQPSKDFEELGNQMQSKASDLMEQRNNILQSQNKTQTRDYLTPLYNQIEDLKSQPQTPKVKSILKGMNDVYDAEVENLNKNGELDSLTAEQRKEWHGRQQGIERGFPEETSAGVIQAHNTLRDSLKNQLEESHPDIAEPNSQYGGLTGAQESLGTSASKALNMKQPGFIRQTLGRILPWLIENPAYRMGSIAKELATEGQSNILSKSTNKIVDLRNTIDELMNKLPEAYPDNGQIEYPRGNPQLPAPPQKALPDISRKERIGRGLQNQGSGPIIKAEGSSTINMPQVLESDRQRIAQQMGIPYYGSEKQFPIPQGRLEKPSTRVSGLLREILNRRKSNFK